MIENFTWIGSQSVLIDVFFFPISPNFLELRNFWEILFLADMFLDSDNQNKNKQFLMFLKTITLPIFFKEKTKLAVGLVISLPPSLLPILTLPFLFLFL